MMKQATAAAMPLSDEWRRWIAENILIGASAADLAATLQANGVPLQTALAEIKLAATSPYLAGAEILRRRIAKRMVTPHSLKKTSKLEC